MMEPNVSVFYCPVCYRETEHEVLMAGYSATRWKCKVCGRSEFTGESVMVRTLSEKARDAESLR